jgi:hypothetical protein
VDGISVTKTAHNRSRITDVDRQAQESDTLQLLEISSAVLFECAQNNNESRVVPQVLAKYGGSPVMRR